MMRLGDVVQINPESVGKAYPHSQIQYIEISSVGTGLLEGFKPMLLVEAPSRAKRIVRAGDTLLATVRPNLRSYCYLRMPPQNTVASTGFAVFRATSKIDSRFLYFTVSSQPFTDFLCANVKGAAYPAVDSEAIARAEINLPDLSTQRRIASILSAYDDLIENNTRRIAILEEMARRVYEEWFVRFRFPGHDNSAGQPNWTTESRPEGVSVTDCTNQQVQMVESKLGLIPKGWSIRKLGDVIELCYGKALKSEQRREGPWPVYGSSGVVGCHEQSLVDGPGIIVGRKGNVGSVHWCDTNFYPIDTVYFVRTELPLHYVFFNLQQQHFINNDAAVPGLNRNQAYSLRFVVPAPNVLTMFVKVCTPIFDQVRILNKMNANLWITRDLLLPRLISGEIDVSSVLEPAAEQNNERA